MGRELRRVALDFQWPLNEVWEGFVNPHYRRCPKASTFECSRGSSNAGAWLDAISRFIALIGEEAANEPFAEQRKVRGLTYPHPYLTEWPQAPRESFHSQRLLTFTPELHTFVEGLAGKKIESNEFPGSSLAWEIQKALLKAAGIDPEGEWGMCLVCKGEGMDPAAKEAYDAWKPTSPPEGEGWQLWETVSEGSPISNVYATEDAFVEYLIGAGYSEKAARNFCKIGCVSSMLMVDGKIYKNIEACAVDE